MRVLTCKICSDYMYFVDAPKMGIDLVLTPRNDGLEAELVCQGCGHQERGVFVFVRFATDDISREEIVYAHARAQATQRVLQRNKRIWVVCQLIRLPGENDRQMSGYLTCEHAASSYGLPVFVVAANGQVFGPADLEPGYVIIEDRSHAKDLADTAKMFARAKDAGYNVKF